MVTRIDTIFPGSFFIFQVSKFYFPGFPISVIGHFVQLSVRKKSSRYYQVSRFFPVCDNPGTLTLVTFRQSTILPLLHCGILLQFLSLGTMLSSSSDHKQTINNYVTHAREIGMHKLPVGGSELNLSALQVVQIKFWPLIAE